MNNVFFDDLVVNGVEDKNLFIDTKKVKNRKIKLAILLTLAYISPAPLSVSRQYANGQVSEWSKEHDWKSCVRQNRTEGSNPSLSAEKAHNSMVYVDL